MRNFLAGIIAVIMVTSVLSAQNIGKAARVSYVANTTATTVTVGGIFSTDNSGAQILQFGSELRKGDIRAGAIDTSLSETIDATAGGKLAVDVTLKMNTPRDTRGYGNSGGFSLSLIDVATGGTLEKIGSVSISMPGRNTDTLISKTFTIDLGKYRGSRVCLMMKSQALSSNPVYSLVDYLPSDADLK